MLDSIYFPHNKKNHITKLKPGETQQIDIDISSVKSYQDGALGIYLYSRDKIFGSYFFYDELGFNNKFKGSHLYLFDKGVQHDDSDLTEPTEFDLFFSNKSDSNPDSIKTLFSLLPQKLYRNGKEGGLIEVKLSYKDFKNEPTLNIYQNGKVYTVMIEHDWDNWGYNQEIYFLYKEGVVKRDETSFKPQR